MATQASGSVVSAPPVSVVIPAHNEAAILGRNLRALHAGAPLLDVVVVCNGCTDDTAEVARAAAQGVRVLEIAQPSKAEAVRSGNRASLLYPRVHLDADVELSGSSLAALVAPLQEGRVLATAARRVLPTEECSLWVRWYYDVWERLPQVRSGLFGRGAFALSAEGQARVSALPSVLSDDLAMSEAFSTRERLVVEEAVVVVRPPRTLPDLLRRRVRIVTGNRQVDDLGLREATSSTTREACSGWDSASPGSFPGSPCSWPSPSPRACWRAGPSGPATSRPGSATRARGGSTPATTPPS